MISKKPPKSFGGINKQKPLLVVLSGPSGTGKSTIVEKLLKKDRRFYESVSATTRTRRRGEKEGRDYFFLTEGEFRNKKRRGEFIETAEVFHESYGTPKDSVLKALEQKRVVLFDIDVQGGMSIRKWRKDAVLIFILPPSLEELKRRLVNRKTESREAIGVRLGRALKEIRFWSKYDYVVCNKDLRETVELVWHIIKAESQRTSRSRQLL